MDTQMPSSPIDFAAMTHPERLQWLAEQKGPCEGPDDGDPNGVHPIGCLGGCRGSSVVPLLPGLRYPCQVGLTVHFGEDDTSHTGETCPGWQASLDAEHLLLSELAKAGFVPEVSLYRWYPLPLLFFAKVDVQAEAEVGSPYVIEETWESALSLAACRAVKGEG